jgi:type IV pilus assembly protein PilM
MEFLSLKTKAFGLDISDLSLKFLMLRKKGKKILVVSFGESGIEPGIIEGGEIKDEKKLVEILRESIKKVKGKRIKTKYCIASLPEEKAFLEIIQMPLMSEEDLKSAILFEAENYIPLPLDQVYLDSQIVSPIGQNSQKMDVLIAAVPKKIVDSYLSGLKKANFQPIAFEIESQAIARAVIEKETTEYPVLIVDLGATRTSLIIFAGKSVRFTTSISISGNDFTETIAKNLGISFSEAENLKKKYGLESKFVIKLEAKIMKEEKGKIFEALIPALVDLSQQIKKYIDFYETHFQEKVKKIILCGGGANLKGLTEFLNLELKIPVELANPWINVFGQKEIKGLSFEKSLSFTTAIGLALRGV